MQLGAAQDARTLLEAAIRVFPHSERLAKQLAALAGQRKPADKAVRVDADPAAARARSLSSGTPSAPSR
jgi:hypothetical protein